MVWPVKKADISKYMAGLGRKGGQARMVTMTPAQRRRIALKASRAATAARKKKGRKPAA